MTMIAPRRLRQGTLCVLVVGVLAVLGSFWTKTQARPLVPTSNLAAAMTGGGLGGQAAEPEPQRVYVQRPITAKAAAVWAALGEPLAKPFPNETPLGGFLQFVKHSTEGEAYKDGIPIYVDPAGLMEAEKTLDSPVSLDVAGIPLSKALTLALRQLDLAYSVDEDGLLTITYAAGLGVEDPSLMILDELARLRQEVAALRSAVGLSSGGGPGMSGPAPAPGGGGFR
jgi:hypothetical protein